MPNNANHHQSKDGALRNIFTIPPALKRIFDQFPLVTYPANEFPISSSSREHVLYIFATRDDSLSFNPTCLKWQTFLKIRGIQFKTRPSNNHASPSGALPFLIPQSGPTITTKSLRKWVTKETGPSDVRYETYSSLLEGRIRIAWLYQLYLMPENRSIMRRLYVTPTSSSYLVQLAIERQLHDAANAEIRKATRKVLDTDLLREAREAFTALSMLLEEKEWFFEDRITLFDASVFAYTHLLLDLQWNENPLGEMLPQNLISHRDRILHTYF